MQYHMTLKLKLLQFKCHVLELYKKSGSSKRLLQKIIKVYAEVISLIVKYIHLTLEMNVLPRTQYACESK
jgi:CII-binding regulator of phage lambda lysogenization HflD